MGRIRTNKDKYKTKRISVDDYGIFIDKTTNKTMKFLIRDLANIIIELLNNESVVIDRTSCENSIVNCVNNGAFFEVGKTEIVIIKHSTGNYLFKGGAGEYGTGSGVVIAEEDVVLIKAF